MDWPRFWSQFSEPIDESSVLPVTKFTYLRELLDDRAKKTMEALPHSPEGYNIAKAIMKEQFGGNGAAAVEMPIRRVCLLQGEDHRPSECTLLTSPKEHKQLLITKKLCFNCTGPYKYSECRSVLKYQN